MKFQFNVFLLDFRIWVQFNSLRQGLAVGKGMSFFNLDNSNTQGLAFSSEGKTELRVFFIRV